MYSTAPPILVKWLRAAGEPSRLRLLALVADGALSVSDLARALKQSEPRVSRHLKILCEAGLLVRLRHGQWSITAWAEGAEGATFVRGLLAQLDRSDPMLVRDRSEARAGAVPGPGRIAHGRSHASAGRWPIGRRRGLERAARSLVLVFGVSHPELLESAAHAEPGAARPSHIRGARRKARAHLRSAGASPAGSFKPRVPGSSATRISRMWRGRSMRCCSTPSQSADTLVRMLEHARRLLTPGGRLWIFEPYESLERSRERIVEHPLARLRRCWAMPA